jgi:glycosyltransferase involved in cell wall biosynthesis
LMRIVIDMQGAQTASRFRGIGRYTMALAQAVVRNRGEHEIILALSGLFPDSIEPIRAAFDGLLPQESIRVWHALPPVAHIDTANHWRRHAAEYTREAFLSSLKPDVIHVTSLFEGLVDNGVTSIGELPSVAAVAVTLYDLIPYIHRKPYLENQVVEKWYLEKIEHLKRADLWLAISESSRKEGIDYLSLPEDRSVNVSTDADAVFQPIDLSPEQQARLREKYGLHRPFVMYTGGIDHRKNIEGLIRAFAKLPTALRQTHQLAIVCSVQPESRRMLEELAVQHGLSAGECVLTGFVPEDDLIALYTQCKLFVFPSWHEGFGLPALEAMRCGAPVIGANTSSLPEVIGWQEALFDPHSDEAMASLMHRSLTDEDFREALIAHGKRQAQKFSWDESARRAISAMERVVAERNTCRVPSVSATQPRLAFVSPLPPERSGIADYSAELLPELAKFYDIEVIVDQEQVDDEWIRQNCPIRTVSWFIDHADHYDRVLYHFGNSHYHRHMFDLLDAIPGVVVLHDFYLSSVIAHIELTGQRPGFWAEALYHAHGYEALAHRFHHQDASETVYKYPCSLGVIQRSLGMIVHSSHSIDLAKLWHGGDVVDWSVIPLMRDAKMRSSRDQARKELGLGEEDFLVCAFGIIGPTKLTHRLLDAWNASSLVQDEHCRLVFVGMNHPGDYGQALTERIRRAGLQGRVRITGWADSDVYHRYLAAADVGVQLRTLSRGETSAAVFDCMNYGLATIVNAHGSMAGLSDAAVWKLPDEFSDAQLVEGLERLKGDIGKRRQIGETARQVILRDHNPYQCAKQYRDAIERYYEAAQAALPGLISAISAIKGAHTNEELMALAQALGKNFPARNQPKQLFVDISTLVWHDAKTGIQRVVRSLLKEWLTRPPKGYRVEPVYATVEQGYHYARQFTQKFLGISFEALQDAPIDYAPGDVFFGLDLQPQVQVAQRAFYQALRQQGVQVRFAVYDLLCVRMPQYFLPGDQEGFRPWLEVVSESDGVMCISKSVADELEAWLAAHGLNRSRPFKIDWFHLGGDLDNSQPTRGMPDDAEAVLGRLRAQPSFLMVGTLEPRKGHTQVLDAFEKLWLSGADVNLVIVGKQGWMAEDLVTRLRTHPELNRHLFWLEGISDEYLEKVYAASTCLIAASYGEGFGLPLIEAAQHKLPIIARDIPVFREVAGKHAFYFQAADAQDLAESIQRWLALYRKGQHPKSDNMPWLTWRESAQKLSELLLDI